MLTNEEKQKISRALKELDVAVELSTDEIRRDYWKASGNHTERLKTSIESVYGPSPTPKPVVKPLKQLDAVLAAIHYRRGTEWVPAIFRIDPNELATYLEAVVAFGIDMHLAMKDLGQGFTIKIPSEFFGGEEIGQIGNLLRTNKREGRRITKAVKREIRDIIVPRAFEEWLFHPENTRELLVKQTDFSIMIATSCFLTLCRNDMDKNIYFYNEPPIGGIALVSSKVFDEELFKELQHTFRRLIMLISATDGFLTASLTDYQHFNVEGSFKETLMEAAQSYIKGIQRPADRLGDGIQIDYFDPVKIVKRVGNKGNEARYRLVLRLLVQNNEAFNFLYADNAMIFNKIEEYLNGWIGGYLKGQSGQQSITDPNDGIDPNKLKLNLDVYIAPSIRDVEARKAILYTHEEIPIDPQSNFWIWHMSVFGNAPPNPPKIPAVIYRFSETVGPSIFVGEIASEILSHLVTCKKSCCQSRPLSILDLFSGTLSCELTILRKLEKKIGENLPINFLCIDRSPFPLARIHDMEKIRKYMHIVSVDVFELLSSSQAMSKAAKDPSDVYSKGYDVVIADPPHYLSLDFLYQRVRWLREQNAGENTLVDMALYEHLADQSKTKCLILYFAHKEKEWMGVFMHRILTKAGWDLWSILIGDERILVCFSEKWLEPGCQRSIIQNIKSLQPRYNKRPEPFNLKIYNTLYREV